jgi:hypothetical protein
MKKCKIKIQNSHIHNRPTHIPADLFFLDFITFAPNRQKIALSA